VKSLAWKVGGALVLVALVAVAVMAILTNQNTNREFRTYVDANPAFADTVSRTLAVVYTRGGWSDLTDVLPQLLAFQGDRLVVADASGKVIGDSANIALGQTSSSNRPERGSSDSTDVWISGRRSSHRRPATDGTGRRAVLLPWASRQRPERRAEFS